MPGSSQVRRKMLAKNSPAQISEIQVLMAMMVIKGLYAPYQVTRLNHGIGFDTAAIELILPTYAASLGLKDRICQYMTVNPCPTLIPAIESGFVKGIHCAGSELGRQVRVLRLEPPRTRNGPGSTSRGRSIPGKARHLWDGGLFGQPSRESIYTNDDDT